MKKYIGILLSMMMVFMIGNGIAQGGVDQENIVPDDSVDPARIASATGLDEEIIEAYMGFIQSGEYDEYVDRIADDSDKDFPLMYEKADDILLLYDFEQDGVPELLVIGDAAGYVQKIDVFKR